MIGRRLGWTALDQAASSLSNFLIALVAARILQSSDLGEFSVAYLSVFVLVEATRGPSRSPSDACSTRGPQPPEGSWR